MDFVLQNKELMSTSIISALTLLQLAINYFLSPEKAEKFNFLGRVLDFAVKTKAGFSPKQEK